MCLVRAVDERLRMKAVGHAPRSIILTFRSALIRQFSLCTEMSMYWGKYELELAE